MLTDTENLKKRFTHNEALQSDCVFWCAGTAGFLYTRALGEYRWSSYRAYAGYGPAAPWLQTEPLCRLCGGSSGQEQQRALREYTEQAVTQGGIEAPRTRLVGGLVLGTEAFAQALRRQTRGDRHEQKELRRLAPRVSWEQIVAKVEQATGQAWNDLSQR